MGDSANRLGTTSGQYYLYREAGPRAKPTALEVPVGDMSTTAHIRFDGTTAFQAATALVLEVLLLSGPWVPTSL